MDDDKDHHLHGAPTAARSPNLNRAALSATVHCLTGCAIGEVLGMVIGTAVGLDNAATVALAVLLAFFFGYALTVLPLLRNGIALPRAAAIALASDTASITVMEVVDNAVMLLIPGAMDAHLSSILFWLSLGSSLLIAGLAAYPVNRWMIARGLGHEVAHRHGHH